MEKEKNFICINYIEKKKICFESMKELEDCFNFTKNIYNKANKSFVFRIIKTLSKTYLTIYG